MATATYAERAGNLPHDDSADSKLGVLGGTFDPVHLGHIASALATAQAFGLQKVLMLLSARPPHKAAGPVASVKDRLNMLELATADHARLEACPIEADRNGLSYTYDSLVEIKEAWPQSELFLILGVDAFKEMDSWYRTADVFGLANVIVTSRPGSPFYDDCPPPPVAEEDWGCYDPGIGCRVHKSGHVLLGHEIEGVKASASDIRSRVGRDLPIAPLTGPEVDRYIKEHGLYGDGGH